MPISIERVSGIFSITGACNSNGGYKTLFSRIILRHLCTLVPVSDHPWNMRNLVLGALLLLIYSCQPNGENRSPGGDLLVSSGDLYSHIDTLHMLERRYLSRPLQAMIYARTAVNAKPAPVENLEGIEQLVSSYHLFYDTKGHLRVAVEVPHDSKQEWFAQYAHFFSTEGKTIAFTNTISFYDPACSPRMLTRTCEEIYKDDWSVPEAVVSLRTESGKILDPQACPAPRQEDYLVVRNAAEWLRLSQISE